MTLAAVLEQITEVATSQKSDSRWMRKVTWLQGGDSKDERSGRIFDTYIRSSH